MTSGVKLHMSIKMTHIKRDAKLELFGPRYPPPTYDSAEVSFSFQT